MKETTFEKYKLVIDEYLCNGMNGTRAYQKFYKGASDEVAVAQFSRIITIHKVSEYLKERQADSRKILEITHQDVLERLKKWIDSDITETMDLSIQEIKKLPKDIRSLITDFKHTKTEIEGVKSEVIQLKFVSKERAIDMVNKHIGFYGEHNFQKAEIISKEERERRIQELKKKLLN